MARLTTAQRRNLKPNQFAGKGRSYPVPDKSHAANAKASAKQALMAGRISKAEYDAIVAKANRVESKGKGKKSLAQMLGG